jgi:hypothetical protein
MRLSWSASLVALFAFTACDSTEPHLLQVHMDVQGDAFTATIASDERGELMQVSVPMQLENEGDLAVRFVSCGPNVEEKVDGSWKTIWGPTCPLSEGDGLLLGAGETITRDVGFSIHLDGTDFPGLHVPENGSTLRLVWSAVAVGGTGRLRSRYTVIRSTEFTLSLPQ